MKPSCLANLGQSVEIEPEVVRGFARILAAIYMGKLDQAVEHAKSYMAFNKASDIAIFREELKVQAAKSGDPIEVLTKTIEAVEPTGIMIVPDYLFFQKLFATLVGLKKSIADPNYLLHSARKILVLRGLSAPAIVAREAIGLMKPTGNQPSSGAAARCLKLLTQ